MSQIPLFEEPPPASEERSPIELLAEVIGEEAAQKLARDFGGTRLYIPREPGSAHPLVHSIGVELAARLCHVAAGEIIELPILKSRGERMRERRAIVRLRGEGWTVSAIARRLHCSERHVHRTLASLRAR